LSDGVNRAVVQAHTEGVLTSATIMTTMLAAEDAVRLAKELPDLGVGVHLTLTEGRPICRDQRVRPLLGDDGAFALSPTRLALLSLTSLKVRVAIRTEIAAQIQWLIDKGLRPTHIDSHKHIHTFPVIYSMVCQAARRFGVRAIRWAFEPREVSESPWPLPAEGGARRARTIRVMARANRLQNSDFIRTEAILGIAHTGKIDVNFFRAVTLFSSASVVELMTHPGYAEDLDPATTRLLGQRQVELEALCSDRTGKYLEEAQMELVHYGQL